MKNNNTRKNRLVALILSGMMLSSLSLALAACGDNSSSSTSSSSSSSVEDKKDDGLIKNASFETFSKNNGLNVIGKTPSNWSQVKTNSPTTGSALSSKADSGIVDTTEWDQLTTSGVGDPDFSTWTEEKASAEWNNMTVRDKLAYYKAWETANEDADKTLSSLSFYQAFNTSFDKLPDCANPKTHDTTDTENKNVLMIHNEYSNSTYTDLGTAQKCESSSTVTVKAGMYAQFSVWVKTTDLACATSSGEVQDAVNKGAYISVKNSLGGNSLDELMIKNIDTEGVTENNGWVQYTFYLQGASYADATFSITLGLGQTGGTNRNEYVSGYAFFDDIKCEIIEKGEFVTATGYDDQALTEEDRWADTVDAVYFDSEKQEKVFNTQAPDSKFVYVIDFASTIENTTAWTKSFDIAPTTEESSNGTKYMAAADTNPNDDVFTYQGLGIDTTEDTKGMFNQASMLAAADGDEYLTTVYSKLYPVKGENNTRSSSVVSATDDVLLLLSANGAAYTVTFAEQELGKGEYLAISFLVKTSAMNGFTGANITLKDGDTKTAISSLDTTTVAKVVVKDNDDAMEGWVRCYFFISNETDDIQPKKFTLSVGFGPTTVMDTAKSSYCTGFAAFTQFTEYDFGDNKAAFELASSGDYSKVVSLENKQDEGAGNNGFDVPANLPEDQIKTGFASPLNYKGVSFGSAYVGNGTDIEVNTLATAGLLNKEHKNAYTNEAANGFIWDDGQTTQPLVIYTSQEQAYGFIGSKQTISENSYKTIAVRVKASVGAFAGVYLIDMDNENYQTTLGWKGQLSFWYDDNGNLCEKDPSKKNFNATKDIAFKLQTNGLYKVNPTWSGAASLGDDANKYFANLSAYGEDDKHNKVLGEGAVEYDYNNNVKHDGNDGIAFYYKDGKYYATSDYKTEVVDFPVSLARYDYREKSAMMQQVVEGDGEWQTVIFYIHTGNQAKNYRLEVWSGTRDGQKKNADKYVLFDLYNVGSDESKYSSMLELRKETIENQAAGEDFGFFYEGVYSFYDTDKFLRYDKNLDENAVGNSYEDYKSSAYSSGVAFMQYKDNESVEMYVDYALSEQMPDADVEKDEPEKEEDTESEVDAASIWLLAGSITIAASLLFAVGAVIVRKVILKNRPVKVKKNKKN